jgi:hypothetical protein
MPLAGFFERPSDRFELPAGRSPYTRFVRGLQMPDERQPSPYDSALDDLRVKRDAIDRAIQFLESLRDGTFMAGVGLTGASAAVGRADVMASAVGVTSGLTTANGNATIEIHPGTFHGMTVAQATKKLLSMRKRTLSAPEIAADLEAGGLPNLITTTITSVLHRSADAPDAQVVRVSRGQWGLQEWYPNRRFSRKAAED